MNRSTMVAVVVSVASLSVLNSPNARAVVIDDFSDPSLSGGVQTEVGTNWSYYRDIDGVFGPNRFVRLTVTSNEHVNRDWARTLTYAATHTWEITNDPGVNSSVRLSYGVSGGASVLDPGGSSLDTYFQANVVFSDPGVA